ncbi:MAG: hypothetical protein JNL08_02715 [Planctomycetes bacterium]|nr:hypothetical protein [Planctomycetota bacterium]
MPNPSASPYANPMLRWPGLLLLIGAVWNPSMHGDDALTTVGYIAKMVLLVVALIGIAHHCSGSGAFGRLKRLQRDLPGFRLQPATCLDLDRAPDLSPTLARHGYTVVELDGHTIGSWHDLAAALQRHFGDQPFPREPVAKCLAILQRTAGTRPRRRALVWRSATESLVAHPTLVVEFAALWSAMVASVPPGMLVFLDLPEGPAPSAGDGDAREPRYVGERTAEADRGQLAAAPHDAWWHPQPGELTR